MRRKKRDKIGEKREIQRRKWRNYQFLRAGEEKNLYLEMR